MTPDSDNVGRKWWSYEAAGERVDLGGREKLFSVLGNELLSSAVGPDPKINTHKHTINTHFGTQWVHPHR